jgi:ribonuclease HI
MPWVRASLRGQRIYARARADGSLDIAGGKVEIRYKPTDGRRYDAMAKNLTDVSAEVLPDDACATADRVAPRETDAAAPAAKRTRAPSASAAAKSAAMKAAAAGAAADAIASGVAIAYTDGACTGNPGPAGLGVVVIADGKREELSEFLGHGTNNVAELTAILRAVEMAPSASPRDPLVIHTDSQYAIGVLQKGWKAKANTDLIAEIRSALRGRPGARLVYVPGHSGVPLNERADELAREAIRARHTRRERM